MMSREADAEDTTMSILPPRLVKVLVIIVVALIVLQYSYTTIFESHWIDPLFVFNSTLMAKHHVYILGSRSLNSTDRNNYTSSETNQVSYIVCWRITEIPKCFINCVWVLFWYFLIFSHVYSLITFVVQSFLILCIESVLFLYLMHVLFVEKKIGNWGF